MVFVQNAWKLFWLFEFSDTVDYLIKKEIGWPSGNSIESMAEKRIGQHKHLVVSTSHAALQSCVIQFICNYCKKSFKSKQNLRMHINTHTGEKHHSCKHCHKRFTRVGHLNRHNIIHTGERPFKCNLCDKTFNRTWSLKVHVKSHTGEKPFKCEQCYQKFRRAYALKIHLRTHTGEKPYSCEYCDKRYTTGSALKVHVSIHSNAKSKCNKSCKVVCLYCLLVFSNNHSLKNHFDKSYYTWALWFTNYYFLCWGYLF